jgi:hypothetical protein
VHGFELSLNSATVKAIRQKMKTPITFMFGPLAFRVFIFFTQMSPRAKVLLDSKATGTS